MIRKVTDPAQCGREVLPNTALSHSLSSLPGPGAAAAAGNFFLQGKKTYRGDQGWKRQGAIYMVTDVDEKIPRDEETESSTAREWFGLEETL